MKYVLFGLAYLVTWALTFFLVQVAASALYFRDLHDLLFEAPGAWLIMPLLGAVFSLFFQWIGLFLLENPFRTTEKVARYGFYTSLGLGVLESIFLWWFSASAFEREQTPFGPLGILLNCLPFLLSCTIAGVFSCKVLAYKAP